MPQIDFSIENKKLISYSIFCFAFGTIVATVLILLSYANVIKLVNGLGVDGGDYSDAAIALLKGNPYPKADLQPFFRPPMYSIFMAVIWSLFGISEGIIHFIQAILFGFTCYFIFKFSYLITGNPRFSTLGSIIYALHPFCLFQVSGLQSEVLHTFFFTGAFVLLLYSVIKDFKIIIYLLIGILFGLASLTRPSALPLAILISLTAVFFYFLKTKNLLQSSLRVVILGAGIIFTILPWTYANYLRTNEIIFINDAGGHSFWLGNHPQLIHQYDGSIKNKQEFDEFNNNFVTAKDSTVNKQIAEFEQNGGYSQLRLKERENLWWKAGIANAKESPSIFIRLFFYKIWDFWRPYLNPVAYSKTTVLISAIYFITLYSLSIFGLLNISKLENRTFILTMLAVLSISATLLHALFISMIRYRLPYIDTYLCGLAGIGILKLFGIFMNNVKSYQLKEKQIV